MSGPAQGLTPAAASPGMMARSKALARRCLKPVVRPFLGRYIDAYRSAKQRLIHLEQSVQELKAENERLRANQSNLHEAIHLVSAFGWDYVAMVRRLASLEDQMARLALSGEERAACEEPSSIRLSATEAAADRGSMSRAQAG